MSNNHQKEFIQGEIIKLLEYAERHGIKIYVAGDEEGNDFNEIYSLYGDAKDDCICLSVIGASEEDIFSY